jgi:hypothetical protein
MKQPTIAELRALNPFPWRDLVHPGGLIQMFDANNKEVPLLNILAFTRLLTAHLSTVAETPQTTTQG